MTEPLSCPKQGPFIGECEQCAELDRARDIVRTSYVPPAPLSSNLVARLREWADFPTPFPESPQHLMKDAADEIQQLRAALRGLLAEVEVVVQSAHIPRTWLDDENPDLAIVNAREALTGTSLGRDKP